jgi:hypothetical protein
VDESYIWPDALGRDQVVAVSESEIVAVYPHRSEVPRDVWEHLFSQAEREIGVLVYSGLFLSEGTRHGRWPRDWEPTRDIRLIEGRWGVRALPARALIKVIGAAAAPA